MGKKSRRLNATKSKKEDKKEDKGGDKKEETAPNAPPPAATAPSDSKPKASPTAAATAAGGGVAKAGGGIRSSGESKENDQYVSPFADAPDETGFGFGDEASADLADLEHMLNVEVDEDFFVEPRYFHTLHRVINVLGIQLQDEHKEDEDGKSLLERNPAYQNLQKQAQVVENAIEHMSRVYCNALNRSVIQVGRIAREFEEAINKVETLRKQVQDIQNTIGARAKAQKEAAEKRKRQKDGDNGDDDDKDNDATREVGIAPTSHMSLRELWMKKLESEAIIELISKLEIIMDAPGQFDFLVNQPSCKVGEAVLCLSDALDQMFSEDVRKVVALNKVLEQLLLRKKTAEELIWDTLHDIIYLRSGNGLVQKLIKVKKNDDEHKDAAAKAIGGGDGAATAAAATGGTEGGGKDQAAAAAAPIKPGICKRIYNPFHKNLSRLCVGELLDDDESVDSQDSGASMFSMGESDDEDDEEKDKDKEEQERLKSQQSYVSSKRSENDDDYDDIYDDHHGGAGAAAEAVVKEQEEKRSMMLPQSMLEAPVDLIVDETRCLDENFSSAGFKKSPLIGRRLPRYTDPVLSLRIIVECLIKMGRLHEVEQVLTENVEKEIKQLVQSAQHRTFQRLARRKPAQTIRTNVKKIDDLKDFRLHFTSVLSSFGCVMFRLNHLAQIIRYRIWADEDLRVNFPLRALFLNEVLEKAYNIMQKELKDFLRACLQEHLSKAKAVEAASAEKGKHESGFFTFGILPKVEEEEDGENQEPAKPEEPAATDGIDALDLSTTFIEMPAEKFVSSVLFAMTNTTPQVQHALVFRRSMDRFTKINEELKNQLFDIAGDPNLADMMGHSSEEEELAITFLDKAIQDTVLPSLQADAVRGTIIASEMQDAFELPAENGQNDLQPLDVGMVQACEGMLEKTEPLFMAIHRLPPGGEMFNALVQVLQFLVETFNSMVEPQVSEVCEDTTSDELLQGFGRDKGKMAAAFGRRGAFLTLMKDYEFDLDLIVDKSSGDNDGQTSDSENSDGGKDEKKSKKDGDDLPENEIQREEALVKQELDLLSDYMDFLPDNQESLDYDLMGRNELRRATCLAHSFLKVASVFESRLKVNIKGEEKMLGDTGSLLDAIGILKNAGIRMAKFCRMEVLLQV